MRAISYSRFIPPLLALVFMPAQIIHASDISGLLEKKAGAQEVIARPTITCVSELPRLPVSLRQYEFLMDHPRLSMALARLYDPSLDLYKLVIRSDGLIQVDDPAGLAGDMELVHSVTGRRVYFISGYFEILNMRFNGHMVMNILYVESPRDAHAFIDSTTICYIKVNNAFVGFFAKLMAFLFPKKVDERVGRFANAVRKVAISVHDDPAGAYGKLAASGEPGTGELKEFVGMFLRKP